MRKQNKDVKNVKPEEAQVVASETSAEEVEAYTPETKVWLESNQSILGAFAPIFYLGDKKIQQFAEALGHPITLGEAQKYLVRPDGPEVECFFKKGLTFQPVRYLAYVPKNLQERLANGELLENIHLRFGGQFYPRKDGSIIAVSGRVYDLVLNRKTGELEWQIHFASQLKKAEERFGEWAKPLADCQRVLGFRTERAERDALMDSVAKDIVLTDHRNRRQSFVSVNDAVEAAERLHNRENGTGRLDRVNHGKAGRKARKREALAEQQE